MVLIGSDLIKGLGLDIICMLLIGFIAYKVIKRILKNIV
jgi:ABC-2 type transport system permease protein